MFGELALIYHQPRLATVICLCDTEMCTMDSRQFNKILGILQRQEDQKKNEFIEKEILKDKEYSSLAHVIGVNFVKRVMPKNKIVFRQGEVPEKVYLIYGGQVKLVKECLKLSKFPITNKIAIEQKQKRDEISTINFALKKKEPAEAAMRIEFSLLGKGQMIGEEGLFSGELRDYTAIIDSEAQLYEIDNERFLVVCKNNSTVKALMNKLIEKKLKNLDILQLRALKVKLKAIRSENKITSSSLELQKSDMKKEDNKLSQERYKDFREAAFRSFEHGLPESACQSLFKIANRAHVSFPQKDRFEVEMKKKEAEKKSRIYSQKKSTGKEIEETKPEDNSPSKRSYQRSIIKNKEALLEALCKPSGFQYMRTNRLKNEANGYVFTSDPHTFRKEWIRNISKKGSDSKIILRDNSFGEISNNETSLKKMFEQSKAAGGSSSRHFRSSSTGQLDIKISSFESKCLSFKNSNSNIDPHNPTIHITPGIIESNSLNSNISNNNGTCSKHNTCKNTSMVEFDIQNNRTRRTPFLNINKVILIPEIKKKRMTINQRNV